MCACASPGLIALGETFVATVLAAGIFFSCRRRCRCRLYLTSWIMYVSVDLNSCVEFDINADGRLLTSSASLLSFFASGEIEGCEK